ncbi:hypothetical protein [Tropicimonas aquimaris]|uniref:Uncharacterized protein n=1 Tax=Tropicimonas aquimaris TaxID=914152 RepID=A0ABW3IJ67_9RHOB
MRFHWVNRRRWMRRLRWTVRLLCLLIAVVATVWSEAAASERESLLPPCQQLEV